LALICKHETFINFFAHRLKKWCADCTLHTFNSHTDGPGTLPCRQTFRDGYQMFYCRPVVSWRLIWSICPFTAPVNSVLTFLVEIAKRDKLAYRTIPANTMLWQRFYNVRLTLWKRSAKTLLLREFVDSRKRCHNVFPNVQTTFSQRCWNVA
jgi:hypothetical protein